MSDSDYVEFIGAVRDAQRERDSEDGSNDEERDALWTAVSAAASILGLTEELGE